MIVEEVEAMLSIDKSTWTMVRLGDVVREIRESVKNPEAEGLERVVGLEHLEPESLHIRSWDTLANGTTFTKVFRKGQMLFGRRRAYLKKAALATFDGICSGDITVLEAKEELLPQLLPFLIQNEKFFELAVKNSAGSLSPRAKFKDFVDYEFLLPPRDQQEQLSELLWAGEEMVKRQKLLQKSFDTIYEPYIKQILDSSDHDYISLGELVSEKELNLLTGPFGTVLSAKSYSNLGTPIINPTHINNGLIDGNRGPFVSSTLLDTLTKYIMVEGDIIIGRKGEVGRSAFIDSDSAGFLVGSDSIRFRVNSERLLAEYLFIYINLGSSLSWFDRNSYGSTMPGINESTLFRLSLPLPDLETQKEIIGAHVRFKEMSKKIQIQILSTKALQRSINNQLF